jgi:endonuclease/exonuclease/phosphatase family metal-dependent hydrolase
MKANESNGTNAKLTMTQRALQPVLRCLAYLLVVATVVASASSALAGAAGTGGKRGLDTMTVNLYVGGPIDKIMALDPTDPNYLTELVSTVTEVYYDIVASQPPLRMQGVADQIAARMPDIVSVEEASLLRNQSPGDLIVGGSTPATTVVFDYLQLLTDALAARGAHYQVVATSQEIDVEMPMLNMQTGTIDDARLTDREAILVRTDLPPGQLSVANPQHGNFSHVIQIPETGISILRGWCSVDVFIRGQNFRYICAHLEEETVPLLQVLQAQELLSGPAASKLPVVICGDFNSDPLHRDGSIAYDTMIAGGFEDAWAMANPANLAGGLTWGHDPFLADPDNAFDRRIDFVFYRGAGFIPVEADVVDLSLNRFVPPLWGSDHAALAVSLLIERAPFVSKAHGSVFAK